MSERRRQRIDLYGLSTPVAEMRTARGEKRWRPLRFTLTFPSAGPAPLQQRAGVQEEFPRLSACLSVRRWPGLRVTSVPIPSPSLQPNKGSEEKSSPGSAKWKATLFLFDDSANSSGIPPEIKA